MSVKRITAFEVDGTLFRDEQAAHDAEKAIAKEQLQILCREHFNGPTYTSEMIADVLVEVAGEFLAILQRIAGIPQIPEYSAVLSRKVQDLQFSVRTNNFLIADRIFYVGQLAQKSEQYLLRIPNSGRKSLNEIKEVLASMDLSLGMLLPDWLPDDLRTEELQRIPVTTTHLLNDRVKAALVDLSKMATETTDPDPAFRRAYADIAKSVREMARAALTPLTKGSRRCT